MTIWAHAQSNANPISVWSASCVRAREKRESREVIDCMGHPQVKETQDNATHVTAEKTRQPRSKV
jgi:hypothetical protein